MREVLDRLREAVSALDSELAKQHEEALKWPSTLCLLLLWRAKYLLWRCQMYILDAAVESGKTEED